MSDTRRRWEVTVDADGHDSLYEYDFPTEKEARRWVGKIGRRGFWADPPLSSTAVFVPPGALRSITVRSKGGLFGSLADTIEAPLHEGIL